MIYDLEKKTLKQASLAVEGMGKIQKSSDPKNANRNDGRRYVDDKAQDL